MRAEDVDAFQRCLERGGLALFPSDTVYGLGTDPESEEGVRRLCELKRRSFDMPSAVMFFGLDVALAALSAVGPRTRGVLERLLPGPWTLIVPDPGRRYPLASASAPGRLGIRVPALDGELAQLADVRHPVLQSSANFHGGADPRSLADVDPEIRRGVEVELDGGTLPGIASTVVDLSGWEHEESYVVLREGALAADEVARLLGR